MDTSTLGGIQDLIEAQVARSPEVLALICDDAQLTYGEFDQRANQLAHYLLCRGLELGSLVGICTSRSLDMVVGIYAILKAGGAYVPLDPSYPKDRLSFILQDAQAGLVVTQSEHVSLFSQQAVNLVCIDADAAEIAHQPHSAPDVNITPENLAYVIYTSGSTGQPKGVMIAHSALCNFVSLAGVALNVFSTDVYLQTASIAYALSVRQLMIPLVAGATVVLANAQQMRDPLALFQLIKNKEITLMDMVPSFWRACIQRLGELPAGECSELMDNSLRRIVSIGEPLTSDIPRDWRNRFGDRVQLVNIFGQTETTGIVARYPIPHESSERVSIVPIGHSIPETQLYILDSQLKPVPVGEQGELCVSNPCLANGYLRRPELSAEKFIPNPFQDGWNARLYRTGDMARMREDGNIEFLGRGDQQVKIRGQRLELGEVESVIREHKSVRDCVVVARGDQPDEKFLAAYIVSGDKVLSSSELRDFLRSRLPDYMIPSVFIFMEELPLTPNGKINRLGLPDPSTAKSAGSRSDTYEGPRNRIEQKLANMWSDLLKLDRVGIHENFFDLGGHSLMSVRMFARIERELGVRLPFTSLFHATTIAQIAELVAAADDEVTRWRIVVPVQTNGDKPPFFGIHAHEGGVLFWRDIVSYLPKDQPFYAVQAQGVDGIQKPLNRIPEMAALYIREMRKVQPEGPYYIGGYSMGGEIAFEMAQQLVKQGQQVNLLVLFDTRNPKRSIRPMKLSSDGSLVAELNAAAPVSVASIIKSKLAGHYLRLSTLSPLHKLSYIHNQIYIRVKHTLIFGLVKLYQMAQRRLPDHLLVHYLKKEHMEALVNYAPSVYPGKVTLFRATQTLERNPDNSLLGWRPLAAGGLDLYHFDAPHEIVNGKYAREVARTLNECLNRAREL